MKSTKFWHIETYNKSYVLQANTLKQAWSMLTSLHYDVDVEKVIKVFETKGNAVKEHSSFELLA